MTKKRDDIILAIDNIGNDITIKSVKGWIHNKQKDKLSQFFNYRLYGRYIKPFDFNDSDYKKSYKNGFAMMASACLLIERFVSFANDTFIDSNKNSERCFGWFFNQIQEFNAFSLDGLTSAQYEDLKQHINNKGIPRDFYRNVRCGILHSAETRNNWKIIRNGVLFEEKTKKINATLFLKTLQKVLIKYRDELIASDWDDKIWKVYIKRINEIIKRS